MQGREVHPRLLRRENRPAAAGSALETRATQAALERISHRNRNRAAGIALDNPRSGRRRAPTMAVEVNSAHRLCLVTLHRRCRVTPLRLRLVTPLRPRLGTARLLCRITARLVITRHIPIHLATARRLALRMEEMADHEVAAETDHEMAAMAGPTAAEAGILPAGTAGNMNDFPSAAPA